MKQLVTSCEVAKIVTVQKNTGEQKNISKTLFSRVLDWEDKAMQMWQIIYRECLSVVFGAKMSEEFLLFYQLWFCQLYFSEAK